MLYGVSVLTQCQKMGFDSREQFGESGAYTTSSLNRDLWKCPSISDILSVPKFANAPLVGEILGKPLSANSTLLLGECRDLRSDDACQ
jgi:hypothetical protein